MHETEEKIQNYNNDTQSSSEGVRSIVPTVLTALSEEGIKLADNKSDQKCTKCNRDLTGRSSQTINGKLLCYNAGCDSNAAKTNMGPHPRKDAPTPYTHAHSSQCSVCSHPDRVRIDADLFNEVSCRKVAEKYHIPKSNIIRHRSFILRPVREAKKPTPTLPTTSVHLQAISHPKHEALEYAAFGLNLYGYCSHQCVYCVNEDDFPQIEFKKATLANIEHDLKGLDVKGDKWHVHLSFVGDPYDCGRLDNSKTRKVLELFKEYKHPFQILTKGGTTSVPDFDLYFEGCRYGSTLTFDNDKDSKNFEPGAALPADRIKALRQAHSRGIQTWVSLEPVIDPNQSLNLIDLTHEFVDFYGIGKLNHAAEAEKVIDWTDYRCKAEAKLKQYGKPYKIKEALAEASKEAI